MARTTQRIALSLCGMLGVALLGLSACATDELNGGGAATSSPSTPAVGNSTDKQATDEPAGDLGPASCLIGSWEGDNSFFLSAIQEFGDQVQSVTGTVVLTFEANGTVTTEYNGWTVNALVEGMTSTVQRTGTDRGTYEADATSLTLQDTEVGSQIIVSAAGQEMTVVPEPVNYVAASFTCDSSTAVITTPDGDMQMVRR